MFIQKETVHKVSGLTTEQTQLAKAFLKGAVYCWLKNRKNEVFALRDLFGGENTNWSGTPLQCIWEKQKNKGKTNDEAYEQAAVDVGWLLKAVLAEDTTRTFKKVKLGLTNGYVLVQPQDEQEKVEN